MRLFRSRVPVKPGGRDERILVVQTSFLGDLVLTLPLIAEVRRRFPQARISVLCKAQVQSLLQSDPAIDEVLAYDKNGVAGGLGGLLHTARQLERRGFTIAIAPHKSLRTALLLSLAGIPCRVGFRQSAGWFLYHYRVDRPSAAHDVERNLSILNAFGVAPADCGKELRLEIDPGARQSVARTLKDCGIESSSGRSLIGISPGSVWPMKRWRLEGYAEVIRQLKQKYPCEVLLFGASEDGDVIAKLQQLTDHAAIDLGGRFDLNELPAAIARCDLFICNDTGPMHVAVACGVPVIAIFCATTPSLGFYPYAHRAIVIEKGLHCRPCSPHGGLRCPLGTEDCIRLIRPEHVMDAVRVVRGAGDQSAQAQGAHVPQFMTL